MDSTFLVVGLALAAPPGPVVNITPPPGGTQIQLPTYPVLVPGAAIPGPLPPAQAALQAQAACPGSMIQPFLRLPHVHLVGPCTDGQSGADLDLQGRWVKEFADAAQFPLPRYDLNRTLMPGDGLLIYEGMRLTVYPKSGIYDLEFTATVPETPVTVRLQLEFARPLVVGSIEPGCGPYRLTLPPIRLEPNRDAKPGDTAANTFNVHHRGYSSLFSDSTPPSVCESKPLIGCGWSVTRKGTARFGTPVAIDESYR